MTTLTSRGRPSAVSAKTLGVPAVVGLVVAFSLSSTLVKRAESPGVLVAFWPIVAVNAALNRVAHHVLHRAGRRLAVRRAHQPAGARVRGGRLRWRGPRQPLAHRHLAWPLAMAARSIAPQVPPAYVCSCAGCENPRMAVSSLPSTPTDSAAPGVLDRFHPAVRAWFEI